MPEQPTGGPWWSNPVSRAIDFAAGQPFNNLVTTGLLTAVCAGLYLGVPAAWQAVAEMQLQFVEVVRQEREEHAKQRMLDREDCAKERAMDREHVNRLIDRLLAKAQLAKPTIIDVPSTARHPAEPTAPAPP